MKSSTSNKNKRLAILFFIVQIASGMNILGFSYKVNSIVFLVSSFFLPIIFYLNSNKGHSKIEEGQSNKSHKKWIGVLAFISLLVLMVLYFDSLTKNPINVEFSDVIPTMQYMVSEFIAGRSPYSVNMNFGYPIASLYFPFVWMPLLIPEVLGIDVRFLLIILLTSFFVFIKLFRKEESLFYNALILWISLLLIVLNFFNKYDFLMTMEWLIMFYYILLCLSFFSNNAFLISGAICLCLLSRYSFAFWLPIYAIVFYKFKGADLTKKVVLYTLALIFVFLIPFLIIQEPIQLPLIFKGYASAAISEWNGLWRQGANVLPYQLFGNGKGIAGYWYLYSSGSIVDKVHSFQKLHIVVNIVFALILGILIIKSKRKIIHYPLFLVSSLSACLTIFYQFIQVPYNYLFFPIFGINLVGVLMCFYGDTIYNSYNQKN